MTKEQEVLTFLYNDFFNPVLSSKRTSEELKKNIQDTMLALSDRSAEGIIRYFWSTIAGDEMRTILIKRLEEEGFLEFDKIINKFKMHFNEEWLRQ